jgi:hypothetical protein
MTWVSDHHRRTRDGRIVQRPSYEIGDELVIYDVTDHVCLARVRVTTEPKYDPRRVSRQGRRGDGKRWGWLTEVQFIGAVDLDGAPTLLQLNVDPMSVRQGDHRKLSGDRYERARRLIPDGLSKGEPRTAKPVPIEQSQTESFFQRFERPTKTAIRAEQRMVRAYADYLETRGRTVSRHRLKPSADSGVLFTDLYEHDRRSLIEAKARANRASIRMAIGQLADYARFIKPSPRRRAVLLPERPSDDLEQLLKSQGIDMVWRSGRRYADNARGALT